MYHTAKALIAYLKKHNNKSNEEYVLACQHAIEALQALLKFW